MTHDNNVQENVYHNSNGKFAPGNPGKPKGAAARSQLREAIKTFLNENWKDFPTWFAALKPKEKIETMLNLLPYVVSRLQALAMTDSEGNDQSQNTPTIDYSKLSDATLREIISLQEKSKAELNESRQQS